MQDTLEHPKVGNTAGTVKIGRKIIVHILDLGETYELVNGEWTALIPF